MAETNLSFAKIVANPNEFSWSQVYSAGKLFAVLSLETKEEVGEKDYLNVLGKEIFDTLEQEFFTLETKDMESIKQAVLTTSQKIPHDVSCSLVIGVFLDDVLYVYVLGNGRVSLKRDSALGNLLEVKDQPSDSLKTVSGFLQDNDLVIFQTKQFAEIISVGTLSELANTSSPSETSENLAPIVHEKEEAGAAAIIISHKTPAVKEDLAEEQIEEQVIVGQEEQVVEKPEENAFSDKPEQPFYTPQIRPKNNITSGIRSFISSLGSKLKIGGSSNLSHPRKVILTIVIIILVIFIASVVFAINKQKDEKIKAQFQSIYPQSLKKYNEGESLLALNQNLARDSFSQAKQTLESGKDKLPKNSIEEKQVLDLLAKVNTALSNTSGITEGKITEVDGSSSQILLAETKNSALYFTEDDSSIYAITSTEVFSLDKNGGNKKTIIKNNNEWTLAAGISTYFGNIYVLDKKQSQILKFVKSDSGYSKSNYFSSASPDFSKAVSMTIDSSIYVLSNDGTMSKFTKGSADSFSLSGLDKSLLNPTQVFTNANTDNIYVLDNGNSRIVVFDKTGAYKSQYQNSILKPAKDFEVLEKDKKIYILSGGKIYEIDLK